MNLEMTKYYTMNAWNESTAPAFNLKIYNVIPNILWEAALQIIQDRFFWEEVRELIKDFEEKYDYTWQAGFNGRSNGYLVLYRGKRCEDGIKTYIGKGIEKREVPVEVLRDFRKLAQNIVKLTIARAKEL